MEYEIKKIIKGSKTYFTPMKNGKRFTKINFARKYNAKNFVAAAVEQYGVAKLESIFNA